MSAITFAHVSVARGATQVLSNVSFEIKAGQFVGMLGPNGAGKTTLIRAVLGLVPVSGGTISVLGRPPHCGNPSIGYVPQSRRSAAQLGITAGELLHSTLHGERWGLPLSSLEDRKQAFAALEMVGATDLATRAVADLSGGERQRLFIAQALVGAPRLLLLDEPLISLDPAHQRSIIELVRRISRENNIAVLFSAHEINPLLGAVDRVLYLGSGRAAVGTVDEVINERVLSSLYRTPVRVIRSDGHIFVLAESGQLNGHDHDHDTYAET